MANAPNPKDVRKLNELYQERIDNLKGINNEHERSRVAAQQIANLQSAINAHEKEVLAGKTKSVQIVKDLESELYKITDREKDINSQLEKQVKHRQRNVDIAKQLAQQLKIGWKYLQDQDKIIKTTNLNLGMASSKAVAMRDAFEQSAGYVTRLGGTIGDIQGIMQGYAEETGRARAMSADMVKDITAIGKGTGLGIEQATRLGAQFEIMGYDARSTMEYVQGVVDTSERMGVNTTKVLKVVNDNFKRLNKYTFQQGVKGFAEMAMYAEKFKIDIGDALNAADVARSLEGAIDLTAKLQVMGGEFAKTDPFEMLFLSRNDPAKFTEKIADMTKGVVSFRKMADGSFEKYISPADRDRLAAVAESMGMEAGALTEIAQRQAEIQKMRQQMGGLGLSKEQKEVIEGAAIFNQKSGKFQVQLAGTMHDIGKLTSDQAKAFKIEQKSLEERAKQAMTFDETFKATIETLKASLLPLLKQVNWLLDHTIKPIADMAAKGWGVGGAAAALVSAGLLWKGVTNKLGNVVTKWVAGSGGKGMSGFFGKSGGGIANAIPTSGKGSSGLALQRAGIGQGAAAKGAGMKNLGTGAGIGAAAVGMGAGVGVAAAGISKLADSMSKLSPEQAESLQKIATVLAVTFPVAAIGVGILAAVAAPAAIPLLALGGAILMIGGAVGLAAMGIGKMGEGLADLNNSGGGAGKELLGVAGGIGAITLAMGTGGLLSVRSFGKGLERINKNSSGIDKVGAAFSNIHAVLSGSKDDFIAVQNAITAIAGTNIRSGGMFSELANLLKNPIQVEFKDKQLAVVSNITMEVDGKKLFNETYSPVGAVQKHENAMHNKGDNA